MRIVSWNVQRAVADDEVWNVLLQLDPDIALLQEVRKLPEKLTSGYSVIEHPYVSKKGKPQKFKTAIVSKGAIEEELNLTSEFEWVNKERKFFSGSIVAHAVTIGEERFNVVSVHSPYWSLDEERLKGVDLAQIKLLSKTHKIWCTEILWSVLKNSMSINEYPWIVGGDFNSSETFDDTWGSGNKEVMERMNHLGLQECLRKHNGKLIPTFKNKIGGKVVHQMDHIYVSDYLLNRLRGCNVGDREEIFGNSLSDHLLITADFSL